MRVFYFVAVLIIAFSIVSLSSCAKITDFIFKGMDNLPEGDFISAYNSPLKNYTLNIYLCNGGATVDYSIRGELVNNDDGSKKNIYWSYHEQEAEVQWFDEEVVIINRRKLNVLKDVYDFRK